MSDVVAAAIYSFFFCSILKVSKFIILLCIYKNNILPIRNFSLEGRGVHNGLFIGW